MVEMVVILPLVLILLSFAFMGWDSMQQSIRLTSAARAGAIKAANDLQAGSWASPIRCRPLAACPSSDEAPPTLNA